MKIAQGLQFTVYDRGQKVEKIPTSPRQMLWQLVSMEPRNILTVWKLKKKLRNALNEREYSCTQIKERFSNSPLLAHPTFEEGRIFQDKLIPLSDYLKTSNKPEQMIDLVIDCMFRCWEQGFSEKTYNFTINYGIDKEGRVAVLDFGELHFDKEAVMDDIKTKKWQQSWSLTKDLNKVVSQYWNKALTENLTLKKLDDYWKKT